MYLFCSKSCNIISILLYDMMPCHPVTCRTIYLFKFIKRVKSDSCTLQTFAYQAYRLAGCRPCNHFASCFCELLHHVVPGRIIGLFLNEYIFARYPID